MGSGEKNRGCDREGVEESEMNMSGGGRKVNEEIMELRGRGMGNEVFEGIGWDRGGGEGRVVGV